jgi:hypothetical protein
LNSLFPSLEVAVIVNRQSIYDFPVVATSLMSVRSSSLFDALRNAEQVFAPSSGFLSVYVFPASDSFRFDVDDDIGIVFANDTNADGLILAALLKSISGISATTFGGHHPLFPNGGGATFSPLISDAVGRSLAIGNIARAIHSYNEFEGTIAHIEGLELPFLDYSIGAVNLSDLNRMIARTSERITGQEIAKAVSSSLKAAQIGADLEAFAKEKLVAAKMLGHCCPETIYLSPKKSPVVRNVVIGGFFLLAGWIAWKFYQFRYRRKYGVPRALLI